MKKLTLAVFLTLTLLLTACNSSLSNADNQEPTAMSVPEYSDAFSIEYLADNVKLVTDAENQKFLLVPRGQEVPAGYDDATTLFTPVERAVFFSVTQVGMLMPYDGIIEYMGGVTQEPGTWPTIGNFPKMEKACADGSVKYLGSSYTPDYELLQSIEPELAFVYTGSSAQTDVIAKLEELGIPYAVDNEYMEAEPLGRMEWTRFLASFFNYDEEAAAYVEQQKANLTEMKAKIEDSGLKKPKVAWGVVYDGIVYVPAADSFVGKSIEAAGGEYLFKHVSGSGSSQISVEEFYNTVLEADIWIYSTNKDYVPDYNALLELAPVVSDTPAVINKNVWQFSVDYYIFTCEADKQVIELAAIFYPELYPDYEFKHYNALAE